MDLDAQRRVQFAIDNECRTAADLLKLGLAALQSTRPGNDPYHLHLLLLSSGLERLAKLLLHFQFQEEHGKPFAFRSYRHKLAKIVAEVIDRCFDQAYLKRPAAAADRLFLTEDRLFLSLIELLGNFASGGRYHDLNTIGLLTEQPESPEDRWRAIRDSCLAPNDFPVDAASAARIYSQINGKCVASLEYGIRAMARLMVLSSFAPIARPYSIPFQLFSRLRDDELGSTDYTERPFVSAAVWRS